MINLTSAQKPRFDKPLHHMIGALALSVALGACAPATPIPPPPGFPGTTLQAAIDAWDPCAGDIAEIEPLAGCPGARTIVWGLDAPQPWDPDACTPDCPWSTCEGFGVPLTDVALDDVFGGAQ